MLYHFNLAGCSLELRNIARFQRNLLIFVRDNYEAEFTEDLFKTHFGIETGKWFWKRLRTYDGKVHRALEKYIKYIRENPTDAATILEAFEYDITYYSKIGDKSFNFKYRTLLTQSQCESIKDLMYGFYDILDSGFDSSIHGNTANKNYFNRELFVTAFWNANKELNVCPACDGLRPVEIKEEIHADTDHFLPRSLYPFLAVHPYNLVPICIECNRIIKNATDPIDDNTHEPLFHTFYPYTNPAITTTKVYIKIKMERSSALNGAKNTVKILDSTSKHPRRVASLNRVYELEERWLDRLDNQKKAIMGGLRSRGKDMKRHNPSLTEAQLQNELRMYLKEKLKEVKEEIRKTPFSLIQGSYIRLLLEDQEEFNEAYKQYMGKLK